MPADVRTLILKWKGLRDELLQISRDYPDEAGLNRPMASLGSWPDGAIQPQSDAVLANWRSSMLDAAEETRQFFNYHDDLSRFDNCGLVLELRTRERFRLRVPDCLKAMDELLALLGWHDKPLGVLVDERMRAFGHKQEAVAMAMGIASSTLGRIRTGKTEPTPENRLVLQRYLAGDLPGFEGAASHATDAS